MKAPPVDIEAVKNFIRTHAEHCRPYECCGLIVRRGKHQEPLSCRNVSENPLHNFVMHPRDVVRAEELGKVLMSYHSHVEEGPQPSVEDKVNAEKNRLPMLIVSWPADSWELYTPCGFTLPLEGRPFVYGVVDCFTLLQDYYREKLGIELPDVPYHGKWWKEGGNLFIEHFAKNGFVEVHDGPREHDVLLMQNDTEPVVNHCAIYLGDGMMLHHAPGQLSGVHPYVADRGQYALATRHIIRHRRLLDAAA